MRVLMLILLSWIVSCQSAPIAPGVAKGNGKPSIPAASRAAVFTILVREVSVSRSEGAPWFSQLTDDDALKVKATLKEDLERVLKFELVPGEKIRAQDLYRAGRFPLHEPYYINPELDPIVRNEAEQELMMRTSNALGAKYFVVIVVDHSTTKVLLKPASVTSSIQIQIFSPGSGLIYTATEEESADALPYVRDVPDAEFKLRYRGIMRSTALDLITKARSKLEKRMQSDITILPRESPATPPAPPAPARVDT
ncbi:MAG TPA: hypothetical protein PKN93_01845 [Leptospiraceae bacterium]|nr:hypothetical protein [Leptospiraceae bacterium]